jgi:hypothetical protein
MEGHYRNGTAMTEISDEYMRQRLATARPFTVVILHHGPAYGGRGAEKIIWEHGRRNMKLQADGVLAIVCPVDDGSDVSGVAVFATDPDTTHDILAGDPAVVADVLRFSVHPSFGFPGDSLPVTTARGR